jgi:ABC-type phosphate/phosphonate transport system ATPase subunit
MAKAVVSTPHFFVGAAMTMSPKPWLPPEGRGWRDIFEVLLDSDTARVAPDYSGFSEDPAIKTPVGLSDEFYEQLPEEFQICAVVGATGSGKTNIVRELQEHYDIETVEPEVFEANNRALVSNRAFIDRNTGKNGSIDLLGACGLNTVHTWLQPYGTLSVGEKMRAGMALVLGQAPPVGELFDRGDGEGRARQGLIYDDFGSMMDGLSAQAAARALAKIVRQRNWKFVIIATNKWNLVKILNPDMLVLADYKTSHWHGGSKGLRWTRPPVAGGRAGGRIRPGQMVSVSADGPQMPNDIVVSWSTDAALQFQSGSGQAGWVGQPDKLPLHPTRAFHVYPEFFPDPEATEWDPSAVTGGGVGPAFTYTKQYGATVIIEKKSTVVMDDHVQKVAGSFELELAETKPRADLAMGETITFICKTPVTVLSINETHRLLRNPRAIIGLVVGPSGSGKSECLSQLKEDASKPVGWAQTSVSETDAVIMDLTHGLGMPWGKQLATISDLGRLITNHSWFGVLPDRRGSGFYLTDEQKGAVIFDIADAAALDHSCLLKPFHALSAGQQWQAELARSLAELYCQCRFMSSIDERKKLVSPLWMKPLVVIVDEFATKLDRITAECVTKGVSALLRTWQDSSFLSACPKVLTVIVASAHDDVHKWLIPDWVVQTGTSAGGATANAGLWLLDAAGTVYRKYRELTRNRIQVSKLAFAVVPRQLHRPRGVKEVPQSVFGGAPLWLHSVKECRDKLDQYHDEQVRSFIRRVLEETVQLKFKLTHVDKLGGTERSLKIFGELFSRHHYLASSPPRSMRGVILRCERLMVLSAIGDENVGATVLPVCESKGIVIGFHGISVLTGGGERSTGLVWSEARVVVLPQWQGFGIGPRMSSLVGSALVGSKPSSITLYSTTCHPRLGPWRDRNDKEWRPTWRNHTYTSSTSFGKPTQERYVYAHKFVGAGSSDGVSPSAREEVDKVAKRRRVQDQEDKD